MLDDAGDYDAAWQHFSAQAGDDPKPVSVLSQAAEKTVQKWPSADRQQQPVFVFSDTATGHAAFIDRLYHHGITALTDRFRPSARLDLFSQQWQLEDVANLPEARCHLLRKKYFQHLKRIHHQGPCADFIPMTAMNMALIKKIFPGAAVIILDRNLPDRHLHQQVFANSRYSATDFRSLKNQLIAMNPNIHLLDIDSLMANEAPVLATLGQLFDQEISAWTAPETPPMDRLMLPKNSWKAYRDHLQIPA